MKKDFNIVIIGVGGQGVITLGDIISKAAFEQGFDVKMSEVHGLSQRYGIVPCHVRFGEKIYSASIMAEEADLILALESIEALRACYYASEKTCFVLDNKIIPPVSCQGVDKSYPSLDAIVKDLKNFSNKVFVLGATDASKKFLGSSVGANIYMLGFCVGAKLIPLEKSSVVNGIKQVVPANTFETNLKLFEEGEKEGEKNG